MSEAKKTVLIVDDSAFSRKAAIRALGELDLSVLVAKDGMAALKLLRQEQAPIDVIVTDVNMPFMTGLELVRILRGTPKYEQLPVILLTAESGPETMATVRSLGISAWAVKPIDDKQLQSVVRRVLGC